MSSLFTITILSFVSTEDIPVSRIIYTTMMKRANILILFANDNLQHVRFVVEAFANFLQVEENKFSVSLPCWEEQQIAAEGGWESWLCKKLDWADKVVLVASQQMERTDTSYSQYEDKNFKQALHHIADICESSANSSTTISKFQIVYFENIDDTKHIPPPLKLLPKYQLMEQMESLYFKLHDIEKYGPGKVKEAPWLSEDAYTDSPEGRTLSAAIQYMKNINKYIINNNDSGYISRPLIDLEGLPPSNHHRTKIQLFRVPSYQQSLDNYSDLFHSIVGKHHEDLVDNYSDLFQGIAGKDHADSDFDSVYSSASTRGLYSRKLSNRYVPTVTEV